MVPAHEPDLVALPIPFFSSSILSLFNHHLFHSSFSLMHWAPDLKAKNHILKVLVAARTTDNCFAWLNNMKVIFKESGLCRFVESRIWCQSDRTAFNWGSSYISALVDECQKRDFALAFEMTMIDFSMKEMILTVWCPAEALKTLKKSLRAVPKPSVDANLSKVQVVRVKWEKRNVCYSNRIIELLVWFREGEHFLNKVNVKRALRWGLLREFEGTARTIFDGRNG